MIAYNDNTNKQIISFIKACVNTSIDVFNLNIVVNPPFASRRIEYRLSNFISTGQIYKSSDKTGSGYITKSISEYKCQLIIRIFDTPKEVEILSNKIAGGIQTFEFLDTYLNEISIKNETMRIRPFLIERDNVVVNFKEIIVDACIAVEFKGDIPYFISVDDVEFDIDVMK